MALQYGSLRGRSKQPTATRIVTKVDIPSVHTEGGAVALINPTAEGQGTLLSEGTGNRFMWVWIMSRTTWDPSTQTVHN